MMTPNMSGFIFMKYFESKGDKWKSLLFLEKSPYGLIQNTISNKVFEQSFRVCCSNVSGKKIPYLRSQMQRK